MLCSNSYIYYDSLLEYPVLPIFCENNDKNIVKYHIDQLKNIQLERIRSYRACIWYPELINKNIPTAKSHLVKIYNHKQLKKEISKNIQKYPFVRTCEKSPKDCILSDYDNNIINMLLSSQRTRNLFDNDYCLNCSCKHLLMRELRSFIWECRCFWSRDNLTAVSTPYEFNFNEKNKITQFFNLYKYDLPYHSAVIDIGLVKNSGVLEIIEINTFGPDLLASSGNFSWIEDICILLFSKKTIFRSKI